MNQLFAHFLPALNVLPNSRSERIQASEREFGSTFQHQENMSAIIFSFKQLISFLK
jgi:hypothetical protein